MQADDQYNSCLFETATPVSCSIAILSFFLTGAWYRFVMFMSSATGVCKHTSQINKNQKKF